MIEIKHLSKRYGPVQALDGLDLQVASGAVYGFLGPNGAGKTTTLRILAGLAQADSGQASILGHPVMRAGQALRRLVGVLPEEPAFYPWLTAREFLRDLVASLHGITSVEAERRTSELLATVNLSKAADRRIQGFSRGMRQRLGLASALVHRPPVLLLDEPVSALDPAGRKEVLDLIAALRGETTILLSTHILADVERVCDTIGILNQGRLVIQASRSELLARYASPVLEIELAEPHTPVARQWLAQIQLPEPQVHLETNANGLRLRTPDLAAAQAILLNSLAAQGLLVRRLEIVQPGLEDIFLRLTNNGA